MEIGEHEFLCMQGDVDWWQVGMRACTLALVPRSAAGGDALDLGAGCGYFVRELRRLGLRSKGVELHPFPVRWAEEHGLAGLVEQGSAAEALRQAEGLAFVSCLDVLPHREIDERGTLEAVHRALRPGGHLLLRLPAYRVLYGAHDRFVHQRRRYDVRDVRLLARETGFVPERLSFANTVLFPVVLAARTLEWLSSRRGDGGDRSSNHVWPAPVNGALKSVLLAEAAWLRAGRSLPWGSSLLALLRKGGA